MRQIIQLLVLSVTLFAASIAQAEGCPDMNKLTHIGHDLNTMLKEHVCAKKTQGLPIVWLQNTALPRLMTPAFLGVEPPENWREMVDNVISDCYNYGDVCASSVQQDFLQCLKEKSPILLFQLGSWLGDNCTQLNAALLDHWQEKRQVISDLLTEYLQQTR